MLPADWLVMVTPLVATVFVVESLRRPLLGDFGMSMLLLFVSKADFNLKKSTHFIKRGLLLKYAATPYYPSLSKIYKLWQSAAIRLSALVKIIVCCD